MGSGAPRELAKETGPLKDLDEELSKRLEAALKQYEQRDPEFKTSREDEAHQQLSKAWNTRCNDIVEELRAIGKVIVNQHQVLLDMSQEGAGVGASPWIEEAGLKFPRMNIRLKPATGEVVAECEQRPLLKAANMEAADYDWLEKAVVTWLVHSATNK